MIDGLEKAGSNPTRASFISSMRGVSSYNAGGLLASPIGFTNFGTPGMLPQTSCGQFAYISAGKFVYYDGGKDICGTLFKVNPNA